jgi:type I pantothenate kinase
MGTADTGEPMVVGDLASTATRVAVLLQSGGRRLMVGLGGGVAVGKSTAARALADDLLETHGLETAIVSSDGFLLPNQALLERGLLARKGFPESYDDDAIRTFLVQARIESTVSIPVYDHLVYDIMIDRDIVTLADVVIFEGVNALRYRDLLDFGIYLDAAESDMRNWYLVRARSLRERSRTEESSFFDGFADLDGPGFDAMAMNVWESVNLPNLTECILPTRDHADVVIVKHSNHSISGVETAS